MSMEALLALKELEPALLVQHADALVASLEDSCFGVRWQALEILGNLEPATLAQHAVAVGARLEDSDRHVRRNALATLGKLDPATLAQHAHSVLARLEDSHWGVRKAALQTLGQLEPAALAQHACAVVARLEDDDWHVGLAALETLGNLEPAALAHHAHALLPILAFSSLYRPAMLRDAVDILRHGLPRFVRHGINFGDSGDPNNDDIDFYHLSRRLMGRTAWYRCRIRLRVRSLALYWYALPYRPSGPGHARDVETWDRMNENQDQRASERPSTRKRQKKATGAQADGGAG